MEEWPALMERYLQGPGRLSQAVQDLSGQQLELALDMKSWTIREIIHHIVDGDDIWSVFIRQALGGQNGEFSLSWYWSLSQEEWAQKWGYTSREIQPSLELYQAKRLQIASLLEAADHPWDHCLSITWPDGETQQITPADVIRMQADHLDGHLEDIRRILELPASGDTSGA